MRSVINIQTFASCRKIQQSGRGAASEKVAHQIGFLMRQAAVAMNVAFDVTNHHESIFRGEFAISTAASPLHFLCTWGMPQSELSATVRECSFVGISALRLYVCTEQRFLTYCSRCTILMPCRSNQQFHPRMFECISCALNSSNRRSSFTRF